MISKDRSNHLSGRGLTQHCTKAVAEKNVGSQDQANGVAANELPLDGRSMSEAAGRWLFHKTRADTKVRSVYQKDFDNFADLEG